MVRLACYESDLNHKTITSSTLAQIARGHDHLILYPRYQCLAKRWKLRLQGASEDYIRNCTAHDECEVMSQVQVSYDESDDSVNDSQITMSIDSCLESIEYNTPINIFEALRRIDVLEHVLTGEPPDAWNKLREMVKDP